MGLTSYARAEGRPFRNNQLYKRSNAYGYIHLGPCTLSPYAYTVDKRVFPSSTISPLIDNELLQVTHGGQGFPSRELIPHQIDEARHLSPKELHGRQLKV